MKTIKTLLLILLLFSSCGRKEYRYEIRGKIYIPTSGLNPMHDAIWYTDTIDFDGESLFYHNSDGTKVTINPPFILNDQSLDSTYVNR